MTYTSQNIYSQIYKIDNIDSLQYGKKVIGLFCRSQNSTTFYEDDEYITFDYDVKIDSIFYDLDTKTNTACVTHGYEGVANKTILESYISNCSVYEGTE